jgi:putative endonuclease
MHAPQPVPSQPLSHDSAATGEADEDRALRYLQARGLSVVERNYRCKGGEIDLVLHDTAGVLVFVEVRARVARSTLWRRGRQRDARQAAPPDRRGRRFSRTPAR